MKILAKNGTHQEEIKIIERDGPILRVAIGDREYTLDIEKVEAGVYSVLHNGTSHNMEIIKSEKKHSYAVNTQYQSFQIDIAPLGSLKEDKKRKGGKNEQLTAPIPGNVVSVKVSVGDSVSEGETIVILSAMKMENELKAPISGIISKLHVAEDDVVKENSVLVEIKAVD
jgi:biotin carboxyl carrier protein